MGVWLKNSGTTKLDFGSFSWNYCGMRQESDRPTNGPKLVFVTKP